MKVILSRKGFDSEYGGYPSPILPNGQMIFLKNGIALDMAIVFQKPKRSLTKVKEWDESLQGKLGFVMASLQEISKDYDS